MTPERWGKIRDALEAALELPPDQRAAYLDRVCPADASLRGDVESLLAADDKARSGFLQSPAVPRVTLSKGTKLGDYEVISLVAAGGMGEVYRARDSRLARDVAIKVLPSSYSSDSDRLRRFEQEAIAVAALNHPNILAVFQMGTHQGAPYLVSEFLEGDTLRAQIKGQRIPIRKAMDCAVQLARGLAAAHEKGIVHRDLKPENVFVTKDGRVKILDFGLAKLIAYQQNSGHGLPTLEAETQPGMVIGTAGYMAPEQARGQSADRRSDIFAFGAILYEMLSGKRAFQKPTSAETMIAVLNEDPQTISQIVPNIPPALQKIAHRCLEKNPEQRFQSASDLAFALEALSDTPSSGQLQAATGRAIPRAPRSRKTLDSIAVLPFENASADPDTEYLSDGITESIIGNLSHLPTLRVMARSTVFRYKGQLPDPQKVGNELNVRTVLTGRVVQRGDSLTIGTELVDVANGWRLWGEQYRGKLADLLAVQEEIADEISKTLRLSLTGDERKRLSKRPTHDAQAYQDYLRGRFYWNKRTSDGLKKGIEHFEKAIQKDPSYPLAYVGLADSYNILGYYAYAAPRDAYPKARAAALRALDIDDALTEGQASLADVKLYYDWDWSGAEKEFNRVVERNPAYATGHLIYGDLLTAMGRFKEGMAETEKAQELDPLSLVINAGVGWCFYFARQYDKAIEHLRETLEMDQHFVPGHAWLGGAYLQQGLFPEGITELRAASEISGGSHLYLALLAHAYGLVGDKAQAQKILDQLKEQSARSYVSSYSIAEVCLALDDRNQAFDWLEKAYEERARALVMLKVEPKVDPLRSDPRFQDLLRRMNFPP